jgi:hypothetical protein
MAGRGLSADRRPHRGTAQESGDQSLGQTTEVTAVCSKVLRILIHAQCGVKTFNCRINKSGRHKKPLGAVLLAGVVAVGDVAWGSYFRDTLLFEVTNMNAWVEGVLSEEFRRLVEI